MFCSCRDRAARASRTWSPLGVVELLATRRSAAKPADTRIDITASYSDSPSASRRPGGGVLTPRTNQRPQASSVSPAASTWQTVAAAAQLTLSDSIKRRGSPTQSPPPPAAAAAPATRLPSPTSSGSPQQSRQQPPPAQTSRRFPFAFNEQPPSGKHQMPDTNPSKAKS